MDRSWHLFVKISLTLLVAVGLGLVYLNANLSRQFESHSWAVGAKTYARPLELFLDAPFTVDQVSFELDLLNYQGVAERPGRGQYQNDGQSLWVGLRGHEYPDGIEPDRLIRIDFSKWPSKRANGSIPKSGGYCPS